MTKYFEAPLPKNDKDSERVNTDNGVWMIQQELGKADIHLSTDYQDIEHNLRLGLGLVVPAVIYSQLDQN
jgi:hypothetical protein